MTRNPRAFVALVIVTTLISGSSNASDDHGAREWDPNRMSRNLGFSPGDAVEWSIAIGTARDDWINHVVVLGDGRYVAAGFVDRPASGAPEWDGLLLSLARSGDLQWVRRVGGPGLEALWTVRPALDDTLVAVGFASESMGSGTSGWWSRYHASGQIQSEKRLLQWPGSRLIDAVPAGDGGHLLIGQTAKPGEPPDLLLVRVDAAGEPAWHRVMGGEFDDRGFYGVALADGGFAVSGVSGPRNAYEALVIGVGADGKQRWRHVVGGPGNDPSHGIARLANGRVVMVGYGDSHAAGSNDLFAVTVSPDGELLTHEQLGTPGDDRVMNVVAARDGGAWLVGYHRPAEGGGWDVLLARLDQAGRFEPRLALLDTGHDDHGTTVAEHGDRLVLGGYSSAPSDGAYLDAWLASVWPERLEWRQEQVFVAAFSADPAGRGADAPLDVMRSFVAALNAHDVERQYAHYANGMVYVDDGRRIPPDKASERHDRAFKAANDAVWRFSVLDAGPGRRAEAVEVLEATHQRHPNHTELMQALAVLERDRGRLAQARHWAGKILEVNPADPTARHLLQSLPPEPD